MKHYYNISHPYSATIGFRRVKKPNGEVRNILAIVAEDMPLHPTDYGFDQAKEDALVKTAVNWAKGTEYDEIQIESD
ncbi:hypothetical protein [Methylosinus sp. RM1]|uniref:hypothetical protein n=1 Tax=Methylosinus sp. RM1 TaxID=2583817 RepID=UPI001408A75E|nr:hypothetical protein [Methylosinus sp. RM1]